MRLEENKFTKDHGNLASILRNGSRKHKGAFYWFYYIKIWETLFDIYRIYKLFADPMNLLTIKGYFAFILRQMEFH